MNKPNETGTTRQMVAVSTIRTIEALASRTFGERFLRFNPQFTLFRKGYDLSVELIHHLGSIPPKDDRDRVLRDLACDALDSLWLAEHALLHGYEQQALVLLRRAYETNSLMAYFLNFPDKVKDWENGKRIRQSVIRKALGKAPFPEPEKELSAMYTVYSLFAHVNRVTVLDRSLGVANRITLGCQGNVSEKQVSAVLRELLGQMMWFVDLFNFAFKEVGGGIGAEYRRNALAYRGEVQDLAKGLAALY